VIIVTYATAVPQPNHGVCALSVGIWVGAERRESLNR
jgi:hypothetical protein